MKLPLSVSLISFNEELRIEATINAIRDIATEIIIVDSHSTDRTREIAEELGCKVFLEYWKGYAKQKQSSLEKCTQEWILCLDCDEEVTAELKENIVKKVIGNQELSYLINRRTVYLGKLMQYSWQPDRKLRLVKKSSNPSWIGEDVHEKLISEAPNRLIKGDILHYSYYNISHHFKKAIDYAKISAEVYNINGKKGSIFNLIVNPLYAFVNMYVLKLGFLDGWRGLIAAFSSLFGTFMKYSMLIELQANNKNEQKKG